MAEAVMSFLVDALKPEQSIYCQTEILLPTFSSLFTFSLFATCSLPTQPHTHIVRCPIHRSYSDFTLHFYVFMRYISHVCGETAHRKCQEKKNFLSVKSKQVQGTLDMCRCPGLSRVM